jgi:hypothetical protein
MTLDMLDLFGRASAWTLGKVRGATGKLDDPTPCAEWDVRALLNHMLNTENYFIGVARGEEAAQPARVPPPRLSDDPVADFDRTRQDALKAFGACWRTPAGTPRPREPGQERHENEPRVTNF